MSSLPAATHYHALAAGPERLAIAAHDTAYESSDEGRTWTPVDLTVDHPTSVVYDGPALVVGGPGRVMGFQEGTTFTIQDSQDLPLAALVRTEDGLRGWVLGRGYVPIPAGAEDEGAPSSGPDDGIAALASAGGTVYAAGPNFGLFSTEDGSAWEDLEAPVRPTAVAASRDGTVYVGSDEGVHRRTSDGAWERTELDPAGPVAGLAAGDGDIWALTQGGVLYRFDERTWSEVAATEPS